MVYSTKCLIKKKSSRLNYLKNYDFQRETFGKWSLGRCPYTNIPKAFVHYTDNLGSTGMATYEYLFWCEDKKDETKSTFQSRSLSTHKYVQNRINLCKQHSKTILMNYAYICVNLECSLVQDNEIEIKGAHGPPPLHVISFALFVYA